MRDPIRVLALGVLQRPDGKWLMDKCHDPVSSKSFYRMLGGGVEFGERGETALIREFKEETGREIKITRFLGSMENLFEYAGRPGHEVVLVYSCAFANASDYDLPAIPGIEKDRNVSVWRSLEDISAEMLPLYPANIESFLKTG